MRLRSLSVTSFRAASSALLASAFLLGASVLGAQTPTCEPSTSSNEAKLLAFFATPIAFSPGGTVARLCPCQIRIGFEASYVPSPS